jgi:hypothetical protein
VKELQARLKQLGAPVYRDKDTLWARFKEYEKRAASLAYQRELAEGAERRKVAKGEPPVRMMPTSQMPPELERQAHELTRIPAKTWCEHCVRGKAVMAPHRAAPPL